MAQPVFYLLAESNGAGKTSLCRAAVADGLIPTELEFVNADRHELAQLQHVNDPHQRSQMARARARARAWADGCRDGLIAAKTDFVSETVFSHPSKFLLIEHANAAGAVLRKSL